VISEQHTQEVAADLADELDLWRTALSMRMDKFELALEQNTETTTRVDNNTRELVDMLNSWKGAFRVFDFVGKLAKPLAGIVALGAAVAAWWSHK
jgi:hypothetical protein